MGWTTKTPAKTSGSPASIGLQADKIPEITVPTFALVSAIAESRIFTGFVTFACEAEKALSGVVFRVWSLFGAAARSAGGKTPRSGARHADEGGNFPRAGVETGGVCHA